MTAHVALLRAVNVGGQKRVAMADLSTLLAQLGLADARTLLQSGNLVFRSERRSAAELEHLLEIETERRLGLQTEFFVRSAEELERLIAANPFRKEAERDPAHLVVMFLKDAPAAGAVKALQAAITGPELVRAEGRQAYITYPSGIGTSRVTNAVIEKKLGTRGTGRNWNTVRKLGELASAL